MTDGQYIPIKDRPAFVRKVVAVWRLHHLAQGDELAVYLPADEWPPGGPAEVAGAIVEHPDWYDHPNGVMVIGGVAGTVRFAISVAHRMLAPMSAADLALCTAFGELPTSGADDGSVWFAPDPATGAAPVFVLPRGRR